MAEERRRSVEAPLPQLQPALERGPHLATLSARTACEPAHADRMPWTYILRCGDGSYYVRSTRDLQRRMTEHDAGNGSAHTSKHLPVESVRHVETVDVGTAWALERKIHGWTVPSVRH